MLEKNIDLLRGLSEIISRETGYNLIICKEGGVIIEATLKERIGRVHDIARRIIAGEMDEYIVTKEDEEYFQKQGKDIRQGCNCVIIVNGKRVGDIAIAGDIQTTAPLVRIASKMISLYLEKEMKTRELIEKNHLVAQKVSEQLLNITATIEELTASSEEIESSSHLMENKGRLTLEKIKEINKILSLVENIAKQSNLLALNAMIESARVGVHGRGFAVVAEEIKKLADQSRASTETVNDILNEILTANNEVFEMIKNTTEITSEQSRALQGLNESMELINITMQELQ